MILIENLIRINQGLNKKISTGLLFFLRVVPLCEEIDPPENHHCAYYSNTVRTGFHTTGLSPGCLCRKAGASCREVNE